jgi:hypothetical protein
MDVQSEINLSQPLSCHFLNFNCFGAEHATSVYISVFIYLFIISVKHAASLPLFIPVTTQYAAGECESVELINS